jgi:hypothetical protein
MSAPILVRMPPLLLSALDAASAAESPRPTRPEMVRRSMADGWETKPNSALALLAPGQKAVAAAKAWLEAWETGAGDDLQ